MSDGSVGSALGAGSPMLKGATAQSGNICGSDGCGSGGDVFRSARSAPGVGGRRGRDGARPTGVPEAEETEGDLVEGAAAGRGGSGGNLDEEGTTYAGDFDVSSLVFLMKSITWRASDFVATWTSAKRSMSNVSASRKSSKS